MSSPKRLFALAVLPVVFLAGCGDDSSKASSSGSGSSSSSASSSASPSSSSGLASPATKGNVSDVKVDTKNAKKPTVSIAKDKLPFGTKSADKKMLANGSGKAAGDKDYVRADFVMVNGTTGKTIGSTFGERVPAFNLADENTLPGVIANLKGSKAGDKFVLSLPPTQAFGSAGNQQLGIGPNDNLVLYMNVNKVEDAQKACDKPAGDASLPKVEVPSNTSQQAKLTFPKGKSAPTELTCSTLKEGTGAAVKSGQTVSVRYTGQVWNGTVFDSTAKQKGKPAQFPIGEGQVIPGWDRTVVGKKVGSRLLIVVPPEDGYGAQGSTDQTTGKQIIKGTDTIVFVVDIISAK